MGICRAYGNGQPLGECDTAPVAQKVIAGAFGMPMKILNAANLIDAALYARYQLAPNAFAAMWRTKRDI